MAQRDHRAFTSFLSEEAVFFSGEKPVRGKQAVALEWMPYFADAQAPFSWAPDHVEVLPSGDLALTTGPVYDPSGRIVGRFNSVWRQEKPGQWRVVFDKGSPVCAPPPAPAQ
jgi:ketosteroid isomerase-like protein